MRQTTFIEPIPAGRKAQQSGKTAEDTIAGVLRSIGLSFTRQYPIGATIYHLPRYADFFIHDCDGFPGGLVIEVKWQDGDGSVDEKYPYLVANIRASKVPTVVVLGGAGIRPGACEWLARQVDGVTLIQVLRLEACITWLRRRTTR